MASSTDAPKHEYLVIAPDFENALDKRLAARPNHLEGLKPEPDFWLFGGAYLSEPAKPGETPKMIGSAMVVLASSEEEVRERIKKDAYVQGGVWDYEKIQIYPFKTALRKPL